MKICRSMCSRLLSKTLLAFSVLVVSACNPVGNGIKPVRLVVNGPTGALDASDGRIYQCIRGAVSATLFFSNGTAGDFTSRVHWSSSKTDLVTVSNGEISAAPVTGFLLSGVLTPVSAGTGFATITAEYAGLKDSINITVGTPTEIRVQYVNPQNGIRFNPADGAVVGPPTTTRIGVGTTQDLTVTAKLDGILRTLDSAITWAFVTPNDAVAKIDAATGVITGVGVPAGRVPAVSGELIARASFPIMECSDVADATVEIAPVQSISVVPEFGSDNLIIGNNERFTVLANLGDGHTQDLSTQSVLNSTVPTVAAFSLSIIGTNVLTALVSGGPTNISATFTPLGTGTTPVTSPVVPVSTVAAVLQSIALTPASASVIAGSAEVAQYRVIGTYASGATQDITRTVSLVSGDTTIGQVTSGLAQSGQAVSSGLTPGSTTITATAALPTTPATTATATAMFTTTVVPPPPTP